MKIGTTFKNNDMTLTVIEFYGEEINNVALLQRESDGMFISVRELSRDGNTDNFSWSWGHYFTNKWKAEIDYCNRLNSLLSLQTK